MPIRLLYIGGYSRSGSTLLLRLLGEVPGLLPIGELFDLWQRSYVENQLCGCGEAFSGCAFWRAVTVQAFGSGPEEVDGEGLQMLRGRVQGYTRIPQLWFPLLRNKSYKELLGSYAGVLSQVYKAISAVSNAKYIVDSSKVPQFAWLLGEMPEAEVHMIHLVRDSRATAYSWQRQRLRPEIAWKVQHMDRHSVVRSALEWDAFNLMLRSRRSSLASYTLVRYEDLVANPGRQLERIASNAGGKWASCEPGANGTMHLRVSHTASGNPSRFKSGETVLGLDDEWVRSMPPAKRHTVSILTVAGLARYGYLRRH
jgi:Sulfotransferase family